MDKSRDHNKERLINRLNVHFQPIKAPTGKKLQATPGIRKDLSRDRSAEFKTEEGRKAAFESARTRSITNLKLPSLERLPIPKTLPTEHEIVAKKLPQTQQILNMREMRQRIRSIKVLPTVKVESRESINDTITYLLRNEILTIPKIVAMLQRSKSEEFLYMRVKGIYEYEVCAEGDKGSNYITVSRNGMVSEGELVPLDKLIRDYDNFLKLKKISFFRYYPLIKMMGKWHRGSTVARFVQNKRALARLLHLEQAQILAWKTELKEILYMSEAQGSMGGGWVDKTLEEITGKNEEVRGKMLHMSYKLLEKYHLPISETFELMNKVLHSLANLNLTFQTKLRIHKDLETIYRIGRTLEIIELQSIAFYVISHLGVISQKLTDKNRLYRSDVLEPMRQLDMSKESYPAEKERILAGVTGREELSYKIVIAKNKAVIQPTIEDVVGEVRERLRVFLVRLDRFDYKLVRVKEFAFITNNIIREEDKDESDGKGLSTVKEYIYNMAGYSRGMEELETIASQVSETFAQRLELVEPFLQLWNDITTRLTEKTYTTFCYQDLNEEVEWCEERTEYCQTHIHDGEYFILGWLSQLQLKQQLRRHIKNYREILINTIPFKIRSNKAVLTGKLEGHLKVMRTMVKSVDEFVLVDGECEEMDFKIADYGGMVLEIERLQELFAKVRKVDPSSLVDEKNLLAELKIKYKNFKERREDSYIIFKKELHQIRKDLIAKIDSLSPSQQFYLPSSEPARLHSLCHRNTQTLHKMQDEFKHLNQLQEFFDIKPTYINKLAPLANKLEILEQIWWVWKEYQNEMVVVGAENVMKVQADALVKKYEGCARKVERFHKDPDYFLITQELIVLLPQLLNTLYFLSELQSSILRPQDYTQITKLIQQAIKVPQPQPAESEQQEKEKPAETVTETPDVRQMRLKEIMREEVWSLRGQVQQICFRSRKEQEIGKVLTEYEEWWKGIKLEGEYLEQYPLVIIFNDNDTLRREVQEFTATLLGIINHKYGTFARKKCHRYLSNIHTLAELLALAIAHQDKFLNLFPILTTRYAEQQLPAQYKRFHSILNKTMKNVKWLIKPTQNLNDNTRHMLNNHIKQFDIISRTISKFLESKRVKFQRFYFLQDDDLLEVLVGIGGENNVFRMFEGIRGWLTDERDIKIGVEGVGGEKLALRGWSYKQSEPEVVFKSLEDSIRSTLNSLVRVTLASYQNDLKDLSTLYPGLPWMCIYTVELILYTKQVEINCLQNEVPLQRQVTLIQENISAAMGDALKNSNYITLQLFLLHFTYELRRDDVRSIFDFKWHSFLRYYYDPEGVVMKALGSEHQWGGEYQGLWNLMINTSDIRRAHISVLSNLQHANGVLLQGPSGTGKTESLKELARCMAKYCLVFNCSSQVNVRTLQKLLSGLCYTGSWLCLDEINRLSTQIMSVVANQINMIRNAALQHRDSFNFMGKEMKLRKGVGIFSTMNPIYLKRAKLTENLKSYFRVISVNVPDYQMILEVLLYSAGISSTSGLYSAKISKLFKTLSIQLSERHQYDFGLRAMKSFIYHLTIIRTTLKNEQESIMEALYRTFYSRLAQLDKQTFLKVISDVFGGNPSLKHPQFKVQSMMEAPQTGIIVLGPTSAKTTTINHYVRCFPADKRTVEVFNPTSIELRHFLGESVMGKWEQGVVQRMARGSFENPNMQYLLILDSKLKSETIQNFNTLLDDSKVLSLSNGSRLKIQNNFKILMETPDLTSTSPATITRCNVVYLSLQDVPLRALIGAMVPRMQNKSVQSKLQDMLQLDFNFGELNKIKAIAWLLFPRKLAEDLDNEPEIDEAQGMAMERCFIFAIQLLGWSDRIKAFMNKQNSTPPKRSPFDFYLSYHRFGEGELVELEQMSVVMKELDQLYVPTIRDKFYEYINGCAFDKGVHVMWKGPKSSGKSRGITRSFNAIYQLRRNIEKNILKLSISKDFPSKNLGRLLEEATAKKETDEEEKKLLCYVEDVHLANEQTSQFLRFTAEYSQIFSYKNKEIQKMPAHSIIGDVTNPTTKHFSSRWARHFAELTCPQPPEYMIRNIYHTLIHNIVNGTSTSMDFKTSMELEMDKVVSFLIEYLKQNNTLYLTSKVKPAGLSPVHFPALIPFIHSLSTLNPTTTLQPQHLMIFLLSEMRTHVTDHHPHQDQIDVLKLAFSEVYKHKQQEAYDKTLRSFSDHPSQSTKYTTLEEGGRVTPITDWGAWVNFVDSKLPDEYYLCEFVVLEVLRVLRVLGWYGGNYYLMAGAGMGRRTVLKMAALLAERLVVEPPTEEKKIADWYFDLLRQSNDKGIRHVLILDLDSQQHHKLLAFMEKIHSHYPILQLVSSQNCDYAYSSVDDIAHLYDKHYEKYGRPFDEVVGHFVSLANKHKQLLFYSDLKNVGYFNSNCMALTRQTTYHQLSQFPSESILQVSTKIMSALPEETNKKGLVNVFLKLYMQLRQVVSRNVSNQKLHFKYNPFLHFKVLQSFIQHYQTLNSNTRQQEDIYNRSIMKVTQISELLMKLRESIKEMEPQVKQKTEEMADVMVVLEQKKRLSEEIKSVVMSEKTQIEARNKEVEEMMAEVEAKIKHSEPILRQANDSMLTIKRGELSELRNNANPQPLIRFTLQNMVLLLGQSESWDQIKKVLSDPNLLSRLKAIQPSKQVLQKVARRIDNTPEWTFDSVSKISFGARYMVKWIKNIIKFYNMKFELEKEQGQADRLKLQLNNLEAKLSSKQAELDKREDEVKKIEQEYNASKRSLVSMQELISSNNRKFENAELIKNHLQEQVVTWYEELDRLKALKECAQGTALYITLFLEVMGGMQVEEQAGLKEKMCEHLEKFGFGFDNGFEALTYIKKTLLSGREEHPQLRLDRLTHEEASNAHYIRLLYHLNREPILMDPDNQALSWLNKVANSDITQDDSVGRVVITKESFLSATKNVEMAIRQGHILVLLIEDDIDPFTSQILNCKTTVTGNTRIMEYNKNVLRVHSSFRILLATQSRRPNLSDKLHITHPTLNFQVTQSLLKQHLLKQLVQMEHQEAYELNIHLQIERSKHQLLIKDMQRQIIDSLISSQRQLVEDKEFIDLLGESQLKRGRLKVAEEQWQNRAAAIKRIYNSYDDVADRASTLYISMKQFQQYSSILTWNTQIFIQYFKQAVTNSISTPLFDEDDEAEPPINMLRSNYDFEHYSLNMTSASRPTSALSYLSGVTSKAIAEERRDDFEDDHGAMEPMSFDHLIGKKEMVVDEKVKGTMPQQREETILKTLVEWVKPAFTEEQRLLWGLVLSLMDSEWKDLSRLFSLQTKRKRLKDYLEAGELTDRMKNYRATHPGIEQTLVNYFSELDPFNRLSEHLSDPQILLLCKIVSPQSFDRTCRILIHHHHHQSVLSYPPIKTSDWFQRSDNIHPTLLLMGQDPLPRISEYLGMKRYKNVTLVAMGEGQNRVAEMILENESKKENVVIIHNLHISPSFMGILAKVLQQFQIKPPHPNFRLILVSACFDGLTEQITAYCHKYLIEQPVGLKNQMNYLRSIPTVELAQPRHQSMQLALAYLHALASNLTRYKPYGWNMKYEFNTNDYTHSVKVLKAVAESKLNLENYKCNVEVEDMRRIEEEGEIDQRALEYFIGEIGYVGKLADDIDRNKMLLILQRLLRKGPHENSAITCVDFHSTTPEHATKIVESLPDNDPTLLGLNQNVKPTAQNPNHILSQLESILSTPPPPQMQHESSTNQPIEPINHKLDFINQQIVKYNQSLLQKDVSIKIGNPALLGHITPQNKIFNLKAFSNPRQFFISIAKEVAHRHGVVYEKVEMVWSLIPKDNIAGLYGVTSLKLEGGSILQNGEKSAVIADGLQERDITLYVQAMVKKKDRDNNQGKKLVEIPLFLQEERQGDINSYGDNTNLLTKVRLEATHPQDFWVLRSTAFIAM